MDEQQLQSVSAGFLRLGGEPERLVTSLGPLANLIGTWVGNHGWNLVAVPHVEDGQDKFILLVRKYYETITFSPIGAPVPNRGGAVTQLLMGVHYDLRVTDSETNEPMHIENGMWLFAGNDPEPAAMPIIRQAAVPHGDSVLATGTWSVIEGPPEIPEINTIPELGGQKVGYRDQYNYPIPGFSKRNPNMVLQQAIAEQNIVETVILDVSTVPEGGIINIPFIVKHANATAFNCTYWIEKVKNEETGVVFEQLQYSQQTNIDFFPRLDDPTKLIVWPHVNVNTLVKQ